MKPELTSGVVARAAVHAALADPARLQIIDTLGAGDTSPSELAAMLAIPSNLLAHHLRVLEQAGLVVTRRAGREKLHYLNPVPIRLIHDRWIDKYTEHRVSALAGLKKTLEETA